MFAAYLFCNNLISLNTFTWLWNLFWTSKLKIFSLWVDFKWSIRSLIKDVEQFAWKSTWELLMSFCDQMNVVRYGSRCVSTCDENSPIYIVCVFFLVNQTWPNKQGVARHLHSSERGLIPLLKLSPLFYQYSPILKLFIPQPTFFRLFLTNDAEYIHVKFMCVIPIKFHQQKNLMSIYLHTLFCLTIDPVKINDAPL